MRFVKPLDDSLIRALAASHSHLVSVEENVLAGGAGDGILEVLQASHQLKPVLQLGIPDRFIEHGSRQDNLVDAGLDAASITRAITAWWSLAQHPPVSRHAS
jgi:1-deoxy-D-xylulose-5-phosphate synthase